MANPNHEPAGTSKGGQFARKQGGVSFEKAARQAAGVSTHMSKEDLADGRDFQGVHGRDFARETAVELSKQWSPSQETIDAVNKEEQWGNLNKEQIIGHYLADWTGSSGSSMSKLMIDGVRKQHPEIPFQDRLMNKEFSEWLKLHPSVERDFNNLGEIIYNNTQEFFRSRGILFVHLYRSGVTSSTRGTFSSWSSTHGGFITMSTSRVSIEADVPVFQIFSIPSTGFGNIIENEVVVLGRVK